MIRANSFFVIDVGYRPRSPSTEFIRYRTETPASVPSCLSEQVKNSKFVVDSDGKQHVVSAPIHVLTYQNVR